MALSTTDKSLEKGSGGLPKTIQPGNCSAKINRVELEKFPFKEGAEHLILHLETTKPADDFEGFMIDKDNADLGRHDGQVGKVKASRWAFKDDTTKGGVQISKDREVMKFLLSLCTELGILKWFHAQDNKFETISDFVEAFNKQRPFENIFMNWCIAGREYKGKNNYTNYDLYLPKSTKSGKPFESEDIEVEQSKLLKFVQADHIEKIKT